MLKKASVRTGSLLLLAVLLSSCSFTYLYRQLDWLVPWYVSDYITLEPQQQSELEKSLLAELDWHCSTQLPRYARWFRQLHDSSDAFTRQQLERHYDTTREFWHDLMRRVAKDAAPILASASDEQVAELVRNLEHKRKALEKEYAGLTEKERSKRRIERMSRMLERWLGELNVPQQKRIAQWSAALQREGDEAWVENRKRWQKEFVVALLYRHRKNFTKRLTQLLVEPERHWSESYRRQFTRRKGLTLDMLAEVASAMTPVQRAHLNHELLGWIEDFQALACQAEPPEGKAGGK